MHLGQRIKMARIAKGYTQHDLAQKINKTRPLVSHIEQTGKANHYTLREIYQVLDLDPNDMETTDHVTEEPLPAWQAGEIALLKTENRLLKQEILTLKELVASQKHLIQLLSGKENT